MLKYVKALVQRNELTTTEVIVPEWELPVLRALHDNVSETGVVLIDRPAPDTNDEFERLSQRYRRTVNEDGSQGIPYVAAVYGQFGVGTERLRAAIAAAQVDDSVASDSEIDDLVGAPAPAAEQNSSVGG